MIGDAKPRMTLAKKICKAKARRCLDINLLRSVGWQILSALKFLHDKNLAHGTKYKLKMKHLLLMWISQEICIAVMFFFMEVRRP